MKYKCLVLLLPILLSTGCQINTPTVKTICSICNNSISPVSTHYGEKNLGIINLNSFNTITIEINQYNDAYSVRTAHPFRRNGAPFRFKLSKAQQVD